MSTMDEFEFAYSKVTMFFTNCSLFRRIPLSRLRRSLSLEGDPCLRPQRSGGDQQQWQVQQVRLQVWVSQSYGCLYLCKSPLFYACICVHWLTFEHAQQVVTVQTPVYGVSLASHSKMWSMKDLAQLDLVSSPDPLAHAQKRVWHSEQLFLSHGAGLVSHLRA